MNRVFDPHRAILLDEPETPPFTVHHYQTLAGALSQRHIHPNDQLLLTYIGSQPVALPMLPMVYHHVAQGRLDNTFWMAAFCSLCNSGSLFNPRPADDAYTFAAQGYYDVMVLLADQQTGSYWNHLTGQCVYGPLAGSRLERLDALTQMRAADVLQAHPDTWMAVMDGMNAEETATAERWNRSYRLPADPDMGEELLATGTLEDKRLPRHDMGLGIWTQQTQRYYPILHLYQQHNVIIDRLDGRSVVIILNDKVSLPTAFYYEVERLEIRHNEIILAANAHYRHGLLYVDGQRIHPERPTQAAIRWYGFSSIFPGCDIYSPD